MSREPIDADWVADHLTGRGTPFIAISTIPALINPDGAVEILLADGRKLTYSCYHSREWFADEIDAVLGTTK